MGAGFASDRVDFAVPTCSTVAEPDVCRATTVVDEPEPSVILEPTFRVWLPTRKSLVDGDCCGDGDGDCLDDADCLGDADCRGLGDC